MKSHEEAKAYIVGAGIASLSAAVLLIRDGGFRGSNIRIMEELEVAGGALDGSGDPVKGYGHARRPHVDGRGLRVPVGRA